MKHNDAPGWVIFRRQDDSDGADALSITGQLANMPANVLLCQGNKQDVVVLRFGVSLQVSMEQMRCAQEVHQGNVERRVGSLPALECSQHNRVKCWV